eukprot:CAMPEP_0194060550 /NCGR_PEP_ID=MMETSP0009_2-20130614/72079_1 /TAXON_ID=210454 /ORGANISM="Grammatophora oceanica, Strain CCMP 410" /LENGTH=40 /DNA_ID= /DNA_START= /DNA_END= /DNA_ORIENTATION=
MSLLERDTEELESTVWSQPHPVVVIFFEMVQRGQPRNYAA